ncbi:hypothetical protein AVEN_33517-1 [Araneus ventricosus]|uniref:Uncharacterized protein n=1 Tax=Araneus ventricosus TaxID=182803 RepID=A0A4Y2GMT1_ARAVE|nr:hypothetical protein AVEN_33517-1 [Araneus ventricosus]
MVPSLPTSEDVELLTTSAHVEPRSDDEDDIRPGIPSPSFRTRPAGWHLASTDLACTGHADAPSLGWNLVSSLEPSGTGSRA